MESIIDKLKKYFEDKSTEEIQKEWEKTKYLDDTENSMTLTEFLDLQQHKKK